MCHLQSQLTALRETKSIPPNGHRNSVTRPQNAYLVQLWQHHFFTEAHQLHYDWVLLFNQAKDLNWCRAFGELCRCSQYFTLKVFSHLSGLKQLFPQRSVTLGICDHSNHTRMQGKTSKIAKKGWSENEPDQNKNRTMYHFSFPSFPFPDKYTRISILLRTAVCKPACFSGYSDPQSPAQRMIRHMD